IRRKLLAGLLSLAACLVFVGIIPALGDDITLVPGATIKGTIGGRVRGVIQSESPQQVVVKLGTTTTVVPTNQIASVRYDGQPPSFALAESREAAGMLAEAADLYKKAATEATTTNKPLIAEAAQFQQAEVLANLAQVEPASAGEAISLLDSFS